MRRLVLRNSALNFIAGVSQRLGQTLIFILIARLLTPADTGAYKLANTYTSILLTLSLWGLDHILIREISKNKEAAARYLSNFLTLRVTLAMLIWAGVAMLLPFLPYTAESRQLILIMTATIIPGSLNNLYQGVWVAFEQMGAFSAIMLCFSLVRLVVGGGILWLDGSLHLIAYLFLFMAVAELTANAWLTHRRAGVHVRPWRIDLTFWVENVKIATPLILVSFILMVEYQFDDVILSLFRPEEEVGVYGTAATILALLLFLTRSIQMAVFPVIARAYNQSLAQLQRVYIQSMRFLLLLSFPIALIVSLSATPIITLLFGEAYAEAGPILSVLVWAFFISAFNVSNSRLLIAADRQRPMAWFAFLSMSGNLLLSLLLVPRWGGIGTAWARVLAMPLYSIPALIYVQRHLCPVEWRAFFQFDWRELRLFLKKE